jgi:sugar fermentation stimulation protein A
MRLFRNDLPAFFVSRPNRFLITARGAENAEEINCHCPNPGRLLEFTFPGEELILEHSAAVNADKTSRRTSWTAAAVLHNGAVVPLYAARANAAAAELVIPRIVPNLTLLRPEFPIRGSRFDFYAEDKAGGRHLIEVKACSLVEHGTAMFPDAPSLRALKHLEELADLSGEGYHSHVLFIILHGNPERLVPNLHTDPAFAAALFRLGKTESLSAEAGKVSVHASLLRSDKTGETTLVRDSVPVDLSHGELAEKNSGNYFFILELPQTLNIETGALGVVNFKRGWYVYSGSAAKNLSQRLARHLRKTKKNKNWHIDYLTPFAQKPEALPLRSYRNLECEMAEALKKLGGRAVPRFGCSDCDCGRSGGSHLYYFETPPLKNRDFVDMLLRFRHREALPTKEALSQ